MSDSMPRDPALPLLGELLDPASAVELVATVIDAPVTAVRVVDVGYRPGESVTVRYAVTVGEESAPFTVVAIHGGDLPPGGTRVSDGASEIGFWRFPDDPGLPGLAAVFDPLRLGALLGELGVTGAAQTRLRAYRPGRRAVVEIQAPPHRVFAKVVRPRRVAELQSIHAALSGSVPIPQSRGWQPELGLVFMDAMPGVSVAAALAGGVGAVPSPDELIALLENIAGCTVTTRPRPAPVDRAADHAATLAGLVPEASEALRTVVVAAAGAPAQEPILAHRDFHAAQLLVADSQARLVDVDTVGIGTRADDMAMFVAQLICLARPGAVTAEGYRRVVQEAFEEAVSPRVLRPRIAAALLGFALGPFRVQEPDWPRETVRRIEAAHSNATTLLKS